MWVKKKEIGGGEMALKTGRAEFIVKILENLGEKGGGGKG